MSSSATAQTALDDSASDGRSLRAIIASSRLKKCFRVVLSATICVSISSLFRLQLGFESVIGVLVLMIIYANQVTAKGVERLFGRLFGILLGLWLARLFFDSKVIFIASMVAVLLWSMYRFAEGKIPYASANAGFSAAAVMMIATVSAAEADTFAADWTLQVGIGVAVALLVDRLLPFRDDNSLRAGISELFFACASRLEGDSGGVGKKVHDQRQALAFSAENVSELIKLLDVQSRTDLEDRALHDRYVNLITGAKLLFSRITLLDPGIDDPRLERMDEDTASLLVEVRGMLADGCRRLGRAVSVTESVVSPSEDLRQGIRDLENIYSAMRSNTPADEEEREMRRVFATILGSFKSVAAEIQQIGRICCGISPEDGSVGRGYQPPAAKTTGMRPCSVNPQSLQKSFVVTLTLMLVFGALLFLELPGGEQALVAGLIISAQPNLGRLMTKWKLRCLGIVSGALYGLLAMVVLSHVPYFPVMLLLFALGILVATYVGLGSDRVSYAGLQAGIALALVLVYQPGPPASIDPVISRFWGAVFGGITATVIQHLFWPIDPLERLRRQLIGILHQCGKHFRAAVALTDRAVVDAVPLSRLVSTDLELSKMMLHDSRHAIGVTRQEADFFQRIIEALEEVLTALTTFDHSSSSDRQNPAVRGFLSGMGESILGIASLFDSLQDRLTSSGQSASDVDVRGIGAAFDSQVEEYRRTGSTLEEAASDVAGLALVHLTTRRLLDSLGTISEAVNALGLFNTGGKGGAELTAMKKIRLPKPSVKAWIVVGIVAVVCVAAYYELVCHFTPFTSDAYLQAYVVQIAPQVDGWVTAVHVSNNSLVKRGDKLFEIDRRPYRYTVERLQAEVVQTKQNVKRLERKREEIEALILQRKADLAFAQEEFNKINLLEEKGAYAEIRRDKSLAVLKAKRALLGEAAEELAQVEAALSAQVDGENAAVRVVEAKLNRAQFDLAHTVVDAPSHGYVANLQLSVGSYVKVGEPVVTVIDTNQWWVVANFKENALARIREGQSAEMSLPMYPGVVFKGKVKSMDWGVRLGQGEPSGVLPDVRNPDTWVRPVQRFPVRLELECSEAEFPRRVGASVTVTVFTEDSHFFNWLSRFWLRIGSYLNYLY